MEVCRKMFLGQKTLVPAICLAIVFTLVAAPKADALRRKGRNEYSTQADQQLERLRYIMVPLLRATDHRIDSEDIRVSINDDATIIAASARGGRNYSNPYSW
jgi:hypothetical protein